MRSCKRGLQGCSGIQIKAFLGSKSDLREEGESKVSFAGGTPGRRVGSPFLGGTKEVGHADGWESCSCPQSGLRTPDYAWSQLATDQETSNYVSSVNFLALMLCSS